MKFTLTVAIPAHNEEKNIKNMLHSTLKQKGSSFKLEKIIVVLDGCTDNTLKIVKEIAKKNKIIKIISNEERLGKSARINQVCKINKSDLIGFFDADIVLKRNFEVELMVKEFLGNKNLNLVSARQLPVKQKNFMGRSGNASFLMIQNASIAWRNGNNIHGMQGAAYIMRKKFSKSLKLPKNNVTDAGFLYLTATKKSLDGFKFAKETQIMFRSVSSFKDWRSLGVRTLKYVKDDIYIKFGTKGALHHKTPKKFVILGIISVLLKDPLGAMGAICMNIFIRLFPYSFKENKPSIWEITQTSKATIRLRN